MRKNNAIAWGITDMLQELHRLTQHGFLGLYRSFEITEVLGFQPGQSPVNFISLAVAEPADPPQDESLDKPFLNERRMVLPGTHWKVGIARYRVSLQALFDTISRYSKTGEWQPGPSRLQIGTFEPVAPQFVPANSHQEHPWNRVLKNNFWEGAHVLELFDISKPLVRFLLDDSRVLANLAEVVRPCAPIALDGLSDRLGNVLVQLPVTVISTGVRSSPEGDHTVMVAWHPQVSPRPIRVSSEIYEDSTVDAYGSTAVTTGDARLNLHAPGGGARTHIWDDQHSVLLAATPVTTFITSVAMSVHAIFPGHEPGARQFLSPGTSGAMESQSVILSRKETPLIVGSTPQRPREPWRSARIFAESLSALQERKEFIQYGKVAGGGGMQALDDIRWLMRTHGALGAWLWDPYLTADDVLRTLFFCPHEGADLKALTSGVDAPPSPRGPYEDQLAKPQKCSIWTPGKDRPSKRQCRVRSRALSPDLWESKQAARLDIAKGNCQGLNLEFRIRKGGAGWPFHDRFIIFPNKEAPAIAWSLGTSVNSLGRQHHILQKVSNGEMIANAFLDLWDKLAAPQYLVWKT